MPQQTHYTDPVATTVPTLSQAIEFFTQHARLHGRSRKTLALYAWNFEQLRAYVGNTALDRLDTATLRRFLSDLLDRGWKPTSVAIMHRVLHAFFVFTVKERFNTVLPSKCPNDWLFQSAFAANLSRHLYDKLV